MTDRPYDPRVPRTSLLQVGRDLFARRPVRYSLVSAVAVVVSQAVLLTCTVLLDWRPVPSNITAVALGSIPSYLLNRAWVWGRRGSHDLRREVVPFWIMGFVGLAFSTLLVHVASRWSEAPAVTSGANITAFGLLWVLKYLVLDSVLFGTNGDEHDPAVIL